MLGREGLGMRLPNIHLHTRLIAQVFAKNINGQLLALPGINIPAANFFRPFARTQYMYSSFVPLYLIVLSTRHVFQHLNAPYNSFFWLRLMYYFSNVATHVALCFITRILLKKKLYLFQYNRCLNQISGPLFSLCT